MRQKVGWFVAGALLAGLMTTVVGRADILSDLARLGQQQAQSATSDPLGQVLNQSGTINRALNAAAGSLAVRDGATKIVPIISLGSGLSVGAAQVAGPARDVERVQAVALVETSLLLRSIHARVLIPVDTRNITGSISRVGNVGVAAMVDLRL